MKMLSPTIVSAIVPVLAVAAIAALAAAITFDTNFVELDSSKMIATSESNWAICNHHFPANWRSVSVNGDDTTIATHDGQLISKKWGALTNEERNKVDSIKATLCAVHKVGPANVKHKEFAKLTTFDRNGGISTQSVGGPGNGGSSSSSSSSSAATGGTSIQRTSDKSFIITKPDFPFNWQRVFVNEDVATIVYNDAKVIMLPQNLMRNDEKQKIDELRAEVDKSAKVAENLVVSIGGTFKKPMDFMNNAFGKIFG